MRELDEATIEKEGDGAGLRSFKRLTGIIGLVAFCVLFLEAQVLYLGILLWPEVVSWAPFAGLMKWTGGFAVSFLAPYTVSRFSEGVGRMTRGLR